MGVLYFMKAVFGFALIAMVGCIANYALAQGQQSAPIVALASTNATAPQPPTALSLHDPATTTLRLSEPTDTNSFEYFVSKKTKLRVSGPLIQPFKAKTSTDLTHRVAHLFNPFAKEQPTWLRAPSGPVNTRAWSTLVGWNPGRSAFIDETSHEPPHLDLISINIEKQPVSAEDVK